MIATHYEGEPPDDAVEWWDWMEANKGQKLFEAGQSKFAIFGLGDLTYKYFCKMGKDTKEILNGFGCELLHKAGEGSNDQNAIEEHFEEWKIGLWTQLLQHAPQNPDFDGQAVPLSATLRKAAKFNVQVLGEGEQESELDDLNADEYELNAAVSPPKNKFFELLNFCFSIFLGDFGDP